MPRRKNEIIFQARIEYSDSRNKQMLDREENPDIEQRARRALTEDLPHDMENIFGVNVDVQVKGTRDGSITLFFGAVIAGVGALSRYKSLYDSVQLIQNQAQRVIIAALGDSRYSVSVNAVDPTPDALQDPRYRWWRRHGPFPLEFLPASLADDPGVRRGRDGFFWFLLVLCILEGVTLGLLVYRAVLKTYF